MLQQILRDMYVDPELLAKLDDEQKQILFCKMREEQVRRWKLWTEKLGHESMTKDDNSKKKVSFVNGEDGEPWVWVMGEHKNDKSIVEILKDEALEKARKLASEQIEAEYRIPKIEDLDTSPKLQIEDDMDIYCSVDELREKIKKKPPKIINNYTINHYQNKNKYNVIDTRDVFQELTLNTHKVSHKVALWEKKLTEERTCEILQRMQKKQEEAALQAEEDDRRQEQVWREQERKAKEAEQQIREIARRAREEHRLTTNNLEIETTYSTVNTGVPPGRQAVLEWYRHIEKTRAAIYDQSNVVKPWFHGLITRTEAEKLLLDQPYGTFLIRLSERIWGYAISYRAKEKCKHYLVNANPKYSFSGHNQIEHNSLGDLIDYHRKHQLSGGETLNFACPRSSEASIIELD